MENQKNIWHEKLGYITESELADAIAKYPYHRYWRHSEVN